MTTRIAWMCISACRSRSYTVRTATTDIATCGVVTTTAITANTTASASATIAHGCIIAATNLGGDTASTRLVAAAT